MKQEEKLIETFGEGMGFLKAYIDQKTEYYQLEITEKTAIGTASLITIAVMGGIGLLVLLFGGFTLGYYLVEQWGSFPLAFLAVTGVFIGLLIIVYVFRRPLMINPTLRSILKTLNK